MLLFSVMHVRTLFTVVTVGQSGLKERFKVNAIVNYLKPRNIKEVS